MAKIRKLIILMFFFVTISLPIASFAETLGGTGKSADPCAGNKCQITNPLGSVNTPEALIAKIINSVLGVVGSLALLMFIYGGLTWMTSAGSQEKIKKGQGIILWSTLGLVVIFSSYALIRFVLNTIASK